MRSYRTFLYEGWTVLNFVRRSLVQNDRFKVGMGFKEDVVFFAGLALKTDRIAYVDECGYNYLFRAGSAVNSYVSDDDCQQFHDELLKLGLPRRDYGRFIGYDLITWIRKRNWETKYDASSCRILAFWRKEMRTGELRYSDVRIWWRFALWSWLRFGDVGIFRKTSRLRMWIEKMVRSCLK